jgi:hypothetical protein
MIDIEVNTLVSTPWEDNAMVGLILGGPIRARDRDYRRRASPVSVRERRAAGSNAVSTTSSARGGSASHI